jgi:hypothetical protein
MRVNKQHNFEKLKMVAEFFLACPLEPRISKKTSIKLSFYEFIYDQTVSGTSLI